MKIDDISRNWEDLYKIVSKSDVAKSFLSHCISTGKVPVHLSSSVNIPNYSVIGNKFNRAPTNTPEYIHNYIDTIYEHQYGTAFRSESLFTYVRNIGETRKGLYYVVPIGNDLNMMYVNGIYDFYLQLVQKFKTVALNLVEKIPTENLSPKEKNILVKDIAMSMDDIDDEEVRQYIAVSAYSFISKETANMIISPEFEKMCKKEILNQVDTMLQGNIVTDVDFANINKEELHISSDRFILISTGWVDELVTSMNTTPIELLNTLIL